MGGRWSEHLNEQALTFVGKRSSKPCCSTSAIKLPLSRVATSGAKYLDNFPFGQIITPGVTVNSVLKFSRTVDKRLHVDLSGVQDLRALEARKCVPVLCHWCRSDRKKSLWCCDRRT